MPRHRTTLAAAVTVAAVTLGGLHAVPAAAADVDLTVAGAGLHGSVQPASTVHVDVEAARQVEQLTYLVAGRVVATAPVTPSAAGSHGSAPVDLRAYAGTTVTLQARLSRNGKVREDVSTTFTVRPAAAPVPTVPPAPAPAPTPATGRVSVCGTSFCLDGRRWAMRAGSVYGMLDRPVEAAGLAVAAGLNTIRVTDFLEGTAADAAAAEERWWLRVDRLVAAARQAGLRVLLDLSVYRNLLARQGVNPYTKDWGQLLRTVARRTNTVTRVRYADDPTIALIALAGEAEPPKGSPAPTVPTTAQLTAFFARSLAQWHEAAPATLASTGGFLQLDWDSGIDWRSIMALPHNAACSLHVYSTGDLDTTVPAVASYCRALGKPWIAEEFGQESSGGDASRAAHFTKLLSAFAERSAAGFGIWNLGYGAGRTFDVNPSTPLTLAAVRSAAV
ncbi:cellulase family glycosylhydrolase [Motilibacter aurantiacus]|uniref:cellulase family glycosylhydrolase n=1 Tax=Motilibacter aurantiacus TaxID=2714955 RepID=UPI00140C3450|nr:cellulase family glycosylhydrolase [Motilibacter aurantiacus]NHC44727.1 cellulase family glycosylhydrolase [Motilibacter aurantiacus]